MKNLLKRTVFGLLFLAVMVFGIIWDRMIFGILFLIVLYLSLKEFYTISLGERLPLQQKLGLLTGSLAFLLVAAHCFWGMESNYLGLILLPLLLIPLSCIFTGAGEDFGEVALIYAGLLYIALPISLSPLIMMDGEVFDGWLLLSLFILIWASDVGAYCMGSLFGRREGAKKLAPSISPNKSWVGFWGGLVLCAAAAVGLYFLRWFSFSLWQYLILSVIVSLGGVVGDLFESLWKRHYGVKDSGNCIPGHGGMLDRFDSSLVAIPLAVIYLSVAGLI